MMVPNIMPFFTTSLTCSYIIRVSYWCSNYYMFLCSFHIKFLVCFDHSLNEKQGRATIATPRHEPEIQACDGVR